MLGINKCNKLH